MQELVLVGRNWAVRLATPGNALARLKAEHEGRSAAAAFALVRFLCSKDGDAYCIDQMIQFVAINMDRLHHILYDVGFDYRMEAGRLQIIKSAYYGVF